MYNLLLKNILKKKNKIKFLNLERCNNKVKEEV